VNEKEFQIPEKEKTKREKGLFAKEGMERTQLRREGLYALRIRKPLLHHRRGGKKRIAEGPAGKAPFLKKKKLAKRAIRKRSARKNRG